MEEIKELTEEESVEKFIQEQLEKEKPTLFLNAFTILKDYPIFVSKITAYLLDLVGKELEAEELNQLIFANPRFLYDFLDSHKIYINVMGLEDEWYYSIEKITQSPDFKSRVKAEHAAMMQAIKILNDLK